MTTTTTYEVRISNRGRVVRHLPNTTGLAKTQAEKLASWMRSEYRERPYITVEVVPDSSSAPDTIHLTELNKYFRAS